MDNSIFLPYLNNEKEHAGANRNKKRFQQLNALFMIKFSRDPVIYPTESSWFGNINLDGHVDTMENTRAYKEDLFGLRTLHQQGRIGRHEIDGEHLEYGTDVIRDIFVPVLK